MKQATKLRAGRMSCGAVSVGCLLDCSGMGNASARLRFNGHEEC